MGNPTDLEVPLIAIGTLYCSLYLEEMRMLWIRRPHPSVSCLSFQTSFFLACVFTAEDVPQTKGFVN
jgi:hypothetical protein